MYSVCKFCAKFNFFIMTARVKIDTLLERYWKIPFKNEIRFSKFCTGTAKMHKNVSFIFFHPWRLPLQTGEKNVNPKVKSMFQGHLCQFSDFCNTQCGLYSLCKFCAKFYFFLMTARVTIDTLFERYWKIPLKKYIWFSKFCQPRDAEANL